MHGTIVSTVQYNSNKNADSLVSEPYVQNQLLRIPGVYLGWLSSRKSSRMKSEWPTTTMCSCGEKRT